MSQEVVPVADVTEERYIPVAVETGAVVPFDDEFSKMATTGSWLPRVQLYISSSNECKAGTFPVNHYGLVVMKGQIIDLGTRVEVLPLAWRPKALDTKASPPVSRYDVKSQDFRNIQERSSGRDSGCMYGPEYLLWIPSLKKFATFFMGTKSARREAPVLKTKLDEKRAATLESTFVKTTSYSWQAPKVTGCSVPWPNEQYPLKSAVDKEIEKFKNPPAVVEEATAEEDTEPARDR